jgi:YkoY family integral membrane protein
MLTTYISVIVSLFIIEVLLSIDNALVNATLAESLPESQRKFALRVGIILGAVFRLVALFAVAYIIENVWIKVLGAIYLIYLAIAHLGRVVDEEGHEHKAKDTLRGVIVQIALADIVFSIDNVISAVSFSSNTYLVVFGVLVGVISMLFITPILSKLIHKYKGLAQAAYVIVGLIGVSLFLETIYHLHVGEVVKFSCILAVIAFTITYEHSRSLRTLSNPILKSMQYILAIPLDVLLAAKHIVGRVYSKIK